MAFKKLDSKARFIIPMEVRKQLNIHPEDNIHLEIQGNKLVVMNAYTYMKEIINNGEEK